MWKRLIWPIVVFILSSLLVLDVFFHPGIFTAHDIEANVGRFGAFFLSISEGRLLPSWAGYVANGYGSPILLYSYLLPYYLQLPFSLLGLTLVDTTKIYLLLSSCLSGLFMYLLLRKHVSSTAAGIGSLLYVLAPYRINDIFARGSISEQTAFLVIPLIGLAIYELAQSMTFKRQLFLSLSFMALLLSHPFFTIITVSFFIIYSAYLSIGLSTELRKKFAAVLVQSLILAGLLSAFFIMPFFFEKKYLHYDLNPFSNTWKDQFVSLAKLIKPQWTFIDATGKMEYQTWQIGIPHLLVFILTFLTLKWSTKTLRRLQIVGLTTFGISLFFMLNVSAFIYRLIPILQEIQFPWRFMGLGIVGLSLMGAATSEVILGKIKHRQFPILLTIVIFGVLSIFYLPYARGHGYVNKSDAYYLYELPTNTEGVATTPFWAATPEHYERAPFFPTITAQSGAQLNYLFRDNTKHVYGITTQEPSLVVDHTFYFPNWEVWVNSQKIPIEFQNPQYRGLITFSLPAGRNLVEVKFSDTRVRRIGKIISGLTLLFVSIKLLSGAKFAKRFV